MDIYTLLLYDLISLAQYINPTFCFANAQLLLPWPVIVNVHDSRLLLSRHMHDSPH